MSLVKPTEELDDWLYIFFLLLDCAVRYGPPRYLAERLKLYPRLLLIVHINVRQQQWSQRSEIARVGRLCVTFRL